jgi:hypothetical protein
MREPQEIEDEEHEQVLVRVAAIDLVEPASQRPPGVRDPGTMAHPDQAGSARAGWFPCSMRLRSSAGGPPADQGADEHWDQAEQATKTGWRQCSRPGLCRSQASQAARRAARMRRMPAVSSSL